MGYSTCRGGGSEPDHAAARTCDMCDGCPKYEVGPLRIVKCPIYYEYRTGGSLPAVGEDHLCKRCRAGQPERLAAEAAKDAALYVARATARAEQYAAIIINGTRYEIPAPAEVPA